MNNYEHLLKIAMDFYKKSQFKSAAAPRIRPNGVRAPRIVPKIKAPANPVPHPEIPALEKAPTRVPKVEPSPIHTTPAANMNQVGFATRVKQLLRPKPKNLPVPENLKQYFHIDESGKTVWNKDKILDANGKLKPEIEKIRPELRKAAKNAEINARDVKRAEKYQKIDEAAQQRKFNQNSGQSIAMMDTSFKGTLAKLAPQAKIGFAVLTTLGGLYFLFTGKMPQATTSSVVIDSVSKVSRNNVLTGPQLIAEIDKFNQLISNNKNYAALSQELNELKKITETISNQKLNIMQSSDVQNFASLIKDFDSKANNICDQLIELDPKLRQQSDTLMLHLVDFIDNISASRMMRNI